MCAKKIESKSGKTARENMNERIGIEMAECRFELFEVISFINGLVIFVKRYDHSIDDGKQQDNEEVSSLSSNYGRRMIIVDIQR
jgi:hypothetical protein